MQKLLTKAFFFITCLTLTATAGAQHREADGGGPAPHARQELPCLSDEQRAWIRSEIDRNAARLRAQGKLAAVDQPFQVGLGWPLAASAGNPNPGYHGLSNYVDQDPSFPNFLRDYACGVRTYDLASGYNHQGIDYFLWPFSWYSMDTHAVEIVAAAPGTIVFKQNGNFDRSCSFGGNWNAVYVQHGDGSVAWYGHMKNGSLTPKPVGAAVAAGEYLGLVGSSGSSTGPHLHFEVYDASSNLIDPYAGPCNSLNPTSWWTAQRPYFDSAINQVATHHAPPVFPTCPQAERPNYRDLFDRGQTAYFATYYRDQRSNQVSQFTVYRPNGSVWQTWTHSFTTPAHHQASFWYWSFTLPAGGPEGTWTFEVLYQGQLEQRSFEVVDLVFTDGFESGNLSSWSGSVGGP